ncbi:MAG: bifunctional D-glycero-beta-D-manno-heptose-7-phosphate kinase/D-glycero-beta-D-manno-heptose 1-phosphate adenylyltransferase HldE [Gammaproteobacteria bacterium]|nr:bifunctional D-glycero-beta-D-manno-heptose-7-phosphate kinase/D-glycero-beta-D-manno-heptose 1-phosphate adenylyltransferase HldE [Gammaproteobacteria bacterium]
MSFSLDTFASARVLVVGDVILDRYVYGATTRISPEAPVPIVRIQHTEERPGGAGNVALNINSLGGQATLVGVTGSDEAADTLHRQLSDRGVKCEFVRLAGFPTVTKLRVLSQHQQLIRLDYEGDFHLVEPDALVGAYRNHLGHTDVVVLSDYAKGSLTGVHHFIGLARDAGKPVLVDPKGTDFSRYQGATLLTPNLKELEAVVGVCDGTEDIVEKGEGLMDALDLEALLVTQGERGMTLMRKAHEAMHLPTRARDVFDITGAGDTVIGVLATALAARHDVVQATALANLAAGLVVGKLGAASVTTAELNAALHDHQEYRTGIVTEEELVDAVKTAKLRGETIVMTNGCFDLLHAGHVRYLTEARKIGDRLIVAVNDDASVRHLKGPDRPVITLEHRMAVLDALEAVDWVVPFSEDTPERLICRIKPDALVKGGDYEANQVAGAECIKRNGGKIVIIPITEGASTTRIINTARRAGAIKGKF